METKGGFNDFAVQGLPFFLMRDFIPYMESTATLSPTALGTHIRDLRVARGLTLADLAQASTVSRASLSRIENNEVSPTADTLAKLSSALRLPISQLISPLEDRFEPLVPRATQTLYEDLENGYRRRNVSPPSAQLLLEMVECDLKPHAQISYDKPSFPGHEHHFLLLKGALRVTVDNTIHALGPGDCLRYRLNGSSAFQAGPDGARYILALA